MQGVRLSLLSVVVGILALVTLVHSQPAKEIAQKSFPSIVMLLMEDERGQPLSLGSGFFVQEGVVATCYHVIEGAARGYAKLVGQKTKMDISGIVGIDERRDLVLLAISGAKAPSLPIGDSKNVSVGDEVYVVSNPMGLEGTLSQGIISGIRQVGSDTIFQITAPVSPGSSGGPVLNSKGEVIGIAAATFRGGQNLNFAIPASYLATLLSDVKPPTPLSPKAPIRREKSILAEFGGRSVEGVVGDNFLWEGYTLGSFTFSLRNLLREPIKDIVCLVIFYDDYGKPIDTLLRVYCQDESSPYDWRTSDSRTRGRVIPGGLAIRVEGSVDKSVRELTTPEYSKTPRTRVEFRILDFRVVQGE